MLKLLSFWLTCIFFVPHLYGQEVGQAPKIQDDFWRVIRSERIDSLNGFLKYQDFSVYDALLNLEKIHGADTVFEVLTTALGDLTNVSPARTQHVAAGLLEFAILRKDTFYMMRSYSLLANAISELGENQKALEYCYQALDYAEMMSGHESLKIINNIGSIHMNMGDYRNAKLYYEHFIEACRAKGDLETLAMGLLNIANPYMAAGEFDSAQYYLTEVLLLSRELHLKTIEAYALGNLAYIFVQLGDLKKAVDYQSAGLHIELENSDNVAMIDSHGVLASCYAKLGDHDRAVFHYHESLKIAHSIDAKIKLLDLLDEGQQIFATLGDFPRAFSIAQEYQALHDSLLNAQKNVQFAELREKYETEQKESRIASLEESRKVSDLEIEKKRNENVILIVAAVFLLVMVAFISIFFVQARKGKKEVERRNEMITKINKALNRSQDELLAANKTKDKFFALVAHDLRGPVTSMQGIGRMLSFYRKKGDEDRINQLIEQVDQSSASVNHLLDNLLKWALSQTNGLNFQPEVFETKGLVEECMTIFTEGMKAKEITITVEQETDLMVEADYNMISTVLRNLLSNALKFSPAGGVIQLSVSEREDCAEITVTDSGQGMPEETILKIQGNEPVESTRGTQDEKGTGLGLVLCREFIRLHGQELSISSSDRGTSISFQLQLAHQMA